jgi:uncharacterized protein with gpF-like domain
MASRRRNEKILPAVHPNAGIEAEFRKKLRDLVDEMANSFEYFIKAAYKKNEPAIAQDATPAAELQAAIEELAKRWRKRFREGAPELAAYFAKSASKRSDAALRAILKKAGFTVDFKLTPAMRDILKATVEQNVQLIKSIPEQYLTNVQGAVMRSVTAGRDVGSLAKELQEQYGVTRRRAAFISLDQNNKATAAFTRVRQIEVGITRAIWLHSHGGKSPRRTHVANSGKSYDVKQGWYDPDPKVKRFIFPGELPRCRCVSKSIVKGFS